MGGFSARGGTDEGAPIGQDPGKLGQALIDAGLRTLDAQADALGLPRSTAWTIVKTCHKTSGLSGA
jgi:hypothetical protein